MRIGIISDLHANLEATRKVLAVLDSMSPDKIICLGDIVGYNASPNEVVDLIRGRRIPRIMGNHDAIACGLEQPSSYSAKARIALEWHAAKLRPDNKRWLAQSDKQIAFEGQFLGVHGSPADRDTYLTDWMDAMQQFNVLDGLGIKVCFFGHTHRATIFGEHSHISTTIQGNRCHLNPENRYLINPGSVGQPRDKDPRAAFGLIDTETMIFEFHRVEYDVAGAARRVIAAGLPEKLGERLFNGK